MNPTRTVVLTQSLSFLIFLFAGPQSFARIVARTGYLGDATLARAEPITPDAGPAITPVTFLAWAAMFTILIAAADFDATAELAAAFSVLILISLGLMAGPDAFRNLSNLIKVQGA